jgi:hypothetical protein
MSPLILVFAMLGNLQSPPDLVRAIAQSGRVAEIGVSPEQRLAPPPPLRPGAPPILAFRFLDGQDRHRFGNLDLVLDDAGH